MNIVESIREARKRGATDEEILQEIINQNPSRKSVFDGAFKLGKSSTQILEEIIAKNIIPQPPVKTQPDIKTERTMEAERAKVTKKTEGPTEEERRIEEARKRIEALKKSMIVKQLPKAVTPPPFFVEKPKINLQAATQIPTPQKPSQRIPIVPLPVSPQTMPKPSVFPRQVVSNIPPIPSVPQKPPSREKLWIRLLLSSLLLALLGVVGSFWYWYLVVKNRPVEQGCVTNSNCPANYICNENKVCVEQPENKKCAIASDCAENYICGSEGTCVKKSNEATAPLPLFAVEGTRILSVSSPDELRSELSRVLSEVLNRGEFRQVAIKDTKQNKFISLREFIESMQVRVPVEIYQKINENESTLFIYSQAQGNRFGFAVKMKDKNGLLDILKTNEPAMKDDFKTILTLMMADKPPVSKIFKDASSQYKTYDGPDFRFQTIDQNDIGLCYLISDDYFIFTTSWEGMLKTIQKLAVKPPPEILTQVLQYGSRGKEVEILQRWLAKDATIYPEKSVTGVFSLATRRAVVRFQEKYASEILAPWGLTRGTGIVSTTTRNKLNELYSGMPAK